MWGTDAEKVGTGNRKSSRNLRGDNNQVSHQGVGGWVCVCVCVTEAAVIQTLVPADRRESKQSKAIHPPRMHTSSSSTKTAEETAEGRDKNLAR